MGGALECSVCGLMCCLHYCSQCIKLILFQCGVILSYPHYKQYAVIPVYRTIQHFSQHKANDKVLFTDPFYTSKGGYKVTLEVVPNGQGSGKGTHVSVFMHLMN